MNGLSKEIIESNIYRHVDVLASDEFEGRAPGTEGGEKTKKYLKNIPRKLAESPTFLATLRTSISILAFILTCLKSKLSQIYALQFY